MKLLVLLLLIAPCFAQSTELKIEHRGKQVHVSCTNGGVVVFEDPMRAEAGVPTCRPGSSPCERERDQLVSGVYAEKPVTAYCLSRADVLAAEADEDFCNERHPFDSTDQAAYGAALMDCLKARRSRRGIK